MRAYLTSHRYGQSREACKNKVDVQLVKHTSLLRHSQRNPQKVMNQVSRILANGRKDESANIKFAHNCTKLFNSGSYFHIIELENMPSRNPKVGSNTKKKFIHFDLVVKKDARKAERDERIFETRAKPFNPC